MKKEVSTTGFVFKNKIYIFPPTKYTRYGKKFMQQNCLFQRDLQIWSEQFCHRSYISYFLIKMFLKLTTFRFQKNYWLFFIGVIAFLLFIKNVFIQIKYSIFPPKYSRYRKNVEGQQFLLKKYLQLCLWSFFHISYIFCSLMKHIAINTSEREARQSDFAP